MRGYAAIGLCQPKHDSNVGGVLRAAACYGASLVVISGQRVKVQGWVSDTTCAWRHMPVLRAEIMDVTPFAAVPICIEFRENATPLCEYAHPERAYYIFGPEDGSVPKELMQLCRDVVYVPTDYCMNLAATVNVVLYDRLAKQRRARNET